MKMNMICCQSSIITINDATFEKSLCRINVVPVIDKSVGTCKLVFVNLRLYLIIFDVSVTFQISV